MRAIDTFDVTAFEQLRPDLAVPVNRPCHDP